MRLRSHLFLLVLATLLPMFAFGILATTLVAQREEQLFRNGATRRTLALITAIDTELASHGTSLQALASSHELEEDDLDGFWETARRTLSSQPHWRRLHLGLPSGEVLRDAGRDRVADGPGRDRSAGGRPLGKGTQAVVGDLFHDGREWVFDVRVPIAGGGGTKYVLTAIVSPDSIRDLLTLQRLPADWVGVVIDSQDSIVARTVSPERMIGRPAAESLRNALRDAPEGWSRGTILEGESVYMPFNRSGVTGWAVALGIPAADVEAAFVRTARMLAVGMLVALGIAVSLALTVARRIAGPMSALRDMARAVPQDVPEPPRGVSNVEEVDEVSRALIEAATSVRAREKSLLDADAAKDEFLAMLGHELRNPLAALSSAVQVLRMVRPGDPRAETAGSILERQTRHMSRLVDDLLDVNRVTRGKIHLAREPVDVGEIAASVLRDWRAAGRLDRHRVDSETASAWVAGDAARIEQIVTNLVENAVKYTPEGGRIRVAVSRRGDEVVLEVTDTGIGLSPELAPRVFDLFVQEERSLDRGLGGLGIGLTLVKGLAELHGGRAAAESEGVDRGARFSVVLPAIEAPAERIAESGPRAEGLRRCRILLVEDDDDARQTLGSALELHGHEVTLAADGAEGVAAAARNRPDVALVDIGLPRLDGYEVARRIRAESPDPHIFLVALTGYGQSEIRRRALDAGFDECLRKPVSPEALVALIERSLRASPRG